MFGMVVFLMLINNLDQLLQNKRITASHNIDPYRRSWITSMQWRASARNGSTTGIRTCLWRRSATFVVKKKHHCCLCFVFGHTLLAGDIRLGSLSSFAWLRQEREDGSLLSNGGAVSFNHYVKWRCCFYNFIVVDLRIKFIINSCRP